MQSPASFFSVMVEPTVTEFIQSPGDIRRGLLAAMILNHVTDHVALEGCISTNRDDMNRLVGKTREIMLAKCPELQFVQDVADATKHSKLAVSKKSAGVPREVSTSAQISTTPGLFQAPLGIGVFAEAVEVLAELEDGSSRALLPAVLTVLEAWRAEIFENSKE